MINNSNFPKNEQTEQKTPKANSEVLNLNQKNVLVDEGEHSVNSKNENDKKSLKLGSLYKNRKNESILGMKDQMKKMEKWFLEDKSHLSLFINMDNLDSFLSADFEIMEENNIKEVFQSKD